MNMVNFGIISETGMFGLLFITLTLAAAVLGGVYLMMAKKGSIELIQLFLLAFVMTTVAKEVAHFTDAAYWLAIGAYVMVVTIIPAMYFARFGSKIPKVRA
jgi:hypothetical protein